MLILNIRSLINVEIPYIISNSNPIPIFNSRKKFFKNIFFAFIGHRIEQGRI